MKTLKAKLVLKKSLVALTVIAMIGSQTSGVFAASTSTTPTTTTTKKVTTPPDPSYTYDPATGNWVNGTYSWNPNTGQTSPLKPGEYTYNSATGTWDSNQFVYDASTGTYVPVPPVESAPTPLPKTTSDVAPTSSVTPTTGSNSSTTTSGTSNAFFSGFSNNTVTNNTNSNAQTGNASVTGNTTAGNALSGDASSEANIINELQSTSGFSTGNYSTFAANITGNVNGNLLIDPASLSPTQNTNIANNVVINDSTNNQLNNNIVLNAASGDANVSSNTSGGNATSGNANAVADVVNMINSAISANQSFIGTINIYGDLTGNILLPELLGTTLGSNSGTTNTANLSSNLVANTTNTNAINNYLNTSATSGKATVADNTTAGNATTGSANNTVTVLNLTGKQVVASDSLLVFVNVMGTWVGLIMNAPTGTTSALLASGVNQNSNTNISNQAVLNSNTTNSINNNIEATATTGNANVSDNTSAGNATSGNANVNVNLANVSNSSLDLSGWFGVLFINVYGQWNGSLESLLASTIDPAISSSTPTNNSQPTNSSGGLVKFQSTGTNNAKANFASNQSPLPSSTNTGTTGTNSNILASFESNNVSNLKNSGFNGVKPNLTSPNGTSPVKIGLITLGALAPIGLAQAVSRKQR